MQWPTRQRVGRLGRSGPQSTFRQIWPSEQQLRLRRRWSRTACRSRQLARPPSASARGVWRLTAFRRTIGRRAGRMSAQDSSARDYRPQLSTWRRGSNRACCARDALPFAYVIPCGTSGLSRTWRRKVFRGIAVMTGCSPPRKIIRPEFTFTAQKAESSIQSAITKSMGCPP